MDLVAGYPYWLLKNGLLNQYPRLRQNKTCRVAIMGGGISGALTAYRLVQSNIDCILVDCRAIGLGSTCASTSLLQYELDMPLHKLAGLIGEQKAIRSYQLCGEAVDKLIGIMKEIGFDKWSKRESLYFTMHDHEKDFMQNEWAARKNAAFEVDLLSSYDLAAYGVDAVYGILSQKGATNDGYAFTHALLQFLVKKGLEVFDHTRVVDIQYYNDHVLLKTGEDCVIKADYLVNATGYEVVNFLSVENVSLHCTYAVISETNHSDPWKDSVMMWNTDDPYNYLCVADENRIIIGGRDEPFNDKRTLNDLLEKKANLLADDLKKISPSLLFKKELAWSGVFGKTKDSLPYIGPHSKTPRCFYALGFGGNGITFSVIAADIITNMVLGKKDSNAGLFNFGRQ
jgi:glycine/D-amino acid oxidase-like deaminating enzyme